MTKGTGARKSSRTSTATEKRKAAGELMFSACHHNGTDIGYTTDEGSEEQLKKKLKNLEDRIEKLAGTNVALTDSLRAMQKEKTHAARHRTDDDDGGEGDSSDDDSNEDDSPMLFTSRKARCSSSTILDALDQPLQTDHGYRSV